MNKSLITGLLLLVIGAVPSMGQETLYISPSGPNMAVFNAEQDWRLFHTSSTRISGQMTLSPNTPSLHVEIDLTSAIVDENLAGPYMKEGILEASSYPEITLALTDWTGWPSGGLSPGDSVAVTGSGMLTLHGVTQPVSWPLVLDFDAPAYPGDPPSLVISGTHRIDTAAFGVTRPDYLDTFLSTLDISLHLVGYAVPYREFSQAYWSLWQTAETIAREYGYKALTPTLAILACARLENASLLRRFDQMDIDLEALDAWLTDRLLQEKPKTAADRQDDIWATFLPVQNQAHREAYQLDKEAVDPEFNLLAALRMADDELKSALAQYGLTYDRMLALYKPSLRPAGAVRLIGNPFFTAHRDSIPLRYARNIWDIHTWDNRLYLGHGNSSNSGPASNIGPIPVISYDLSTGQFATEFTVDEEQIDRYRTINGRLMIPGHDPRDPWELGNFYQLIDMEWQKVRTIPHGIHAYDMLAYKDHIFVAEGSELGAMVSRSADGGRSWDSFVIPDVERAYELFVLNDELYVSCYNEIIQRYTGTGFERVRVDLFPDARHGEHPLVVRSIPFRQGLLYLGGDNSNDHQWVPFAAYHASRIDGARRLDLPQESVPYDIVVQGDMAYILTNQENEGQSETTVIVYQSSDLTDWTEITRFNAPSLARSFEYVNGRFYIGLGTTTSSLNSASGNVYEVKP